MAPGGTTNQAPMPRAAITPRAPDHYLVTFTASGATYEKLTEAQALLRHQVPSGDVAAIFDRAVTLLLAELRNVRRGPVPGRAQHAQPRTPAATCPQP